MDIKEKRQEVARELRERAKGYLPFIDTFTLYGIIFWRTSKYYKRYHGSRI